MTKNSPYLQIRADGELRRRLDEIRRLEADLPTRSDMIRRLIDREYEAAVETDPSTVVA